MKLTFIVSTFNRPETLAHMLHCLNLQTMKDFEIIVTDNSDDQIQARRNKAIVEQFDSRFRYLKTDKNEPYSSAEDGVFTSCGEFLCFPSDDNYYVPQFAEIMLHHLDKHRLDFVYCDCIYDPRMFGKYAVLNVLPKTNHIDKGGFIVKRSIFKPFPAKARVSCSDGYFIEELVKAGHKHGKAPGVLWIHN